MEELVSCVIAFSNDNQTALIAIGGLLVVLSAFIGVMNGVGAWIKAPVVAVFNVFTRQKSEETPDHHTQTTVELAKLLAEKSVDADRHNNRADSAEQRISELEETIDALRSGTDPREQQALGLLADGKPHEAEPLLRAVAEDREKDVAKAASAYRHLGAIAALNEPARARTAYARAVELDPNSAEAINALAALDYRLGNMQAAEQGWKTIQRLGNSTASKELQAVALGNLGLIALTRGDLDAAEDFHTQALTLHTELGYKEGMANQLGNLGNVAQTRGDLDAAEGFHTRSLALENELGRKEGMASDLCNLGLVARNRGDLNAAEDFLTQALTLHTELGHKEGMASDLGNLGNIAKARGNLDAAEDFHTQALTLSTELRYKEGMASDLGNLGTVARTRGDLNGALLRYNKARVLFAEVGMAPQVAQVEALISDVQAELNAPGDQSN